MKLPDCLSYCFWWETVKMVTNKLSLLEELVLALYPHPFKAIISYLSPNEAITQADFNKSGLTKKYWLFKEDEGIKS